MTGEWPGMIDHKNLDRADNRWENLRAATPYQNQGNRRSTSKIGAKSIEVTPGGKYRARIRHKNKRIHLGVYSTIEDAKKAYAEAALEYFGEFARSELIDSP